MAKLNHHAVKDSEVLNQPTFTKQHASSSERLFSAAFSTLTVLFQAVKSDNVIVSGKLALPPVSAIHDNTPEREIRLG